MARSKTSQTWLKEHFDDIYVKRAQQEGYRSRAVYKLLEINKKDQLLKPGMTVIDLGAAPGSWSQVAADIVVANARAQNAKAQMEGRVIALDILAMDPLPDVDIILGDFREDEVLAELLAKVGDNKVDLVMSDMAPNISGERSVDGPRAMYLVELTLDLARQILKPGGDMLVKVFHGQGSEDFLKELRTCFDKVVVRKPEASRPRSREVYMLGRGYRQGK